MQKFNIKYNVCSDKYNNNNNNDNNNNNSNNFIECILLVYRI